MGYNYFYKYKYTPSNYIYSYPLHGVSVGRFLDYASCASTGFSS